MCSAVRRRMFEKGISWSPAPRGTDGGAVARTGSKDGGACGACGACGASGGVGPGPAAAPERRTSTSLKTSSRVMRPPGPVPLTSERSIPFSESSRRTMGEVTARSAPSSCTSPPGSARVSPAGAGAGWGAAAGREAGAGCGAAAGWGAGAGWDTGGGGVEDGGGAAGVAGAAGASEAGAAAGGVGRRTVTDHGQLHAHFDGLALGHEDLGEHARGRRRHLGVDFVRRDFEERLVALDGVADSLHPARHRSLGDCLA